MKVKIIFECDMTDWALPEEFGEMSDAEIEQLAWEDTTALLDNALVRIVREP